jgi:hypothetical protein
MKRPDSLAEVMRRVRNGGAFGPTLSEFLDDFYEQPDRRQTMITEEPDTLPDDREYARVGAIGEHLARRWNYFWLDKITLTISYIGLISRRRLRCSRPCFSSKAPSPFGVA